MHAIVVKVTVNEPERADEALHNRLVPNVSKSPGFVAGYWTQSGSTGLSMIVYESEDAARQMADRMPPTVPDSVTLKNIEVREVVAHA